MFRKDWGEVIFENGGFDVDVCVLLCSCDEDFVQAVEIIGRLGKNECFND